MEREERYFLQAIAGAFVLVVLMRWFVLVALGTVLHIHHHLYELLQSVSLDLMVSNKLKIRYHSRGTIKNLRVRLHP